MNILSAVGSRESGVWRWATESQNPNKNKIKNNMMKYPAELNAKVNWISSDWVRAGDMYAHFCIRSIHLWVQNRCFDSLFGLFYTTDYSPIILRQCFNFDGNQKWNEEDKRHENSKCKILNNSIDSLIIYHSHFGWIGLNEYAMCTHPQMLNATMMFINPTICMQRWNWCLWHQIEFIV